uniref:RNA-directed DNA polymerase homolog n=1 Tax=Nicotiana tabacum TaxID=4097 RepID=A0A1S4B553_TOBAC|nr:PREDICTED: RNA-directed DNA polymerase homolog [Nicotiana tabacum]
MDHEIELVPGAKPPARAPYRMSQPELTELRRQLMKMLDTGIIVPSKSSYGSHVLFQKKQNGTLRICVDYRALKKITVKNKYHIPLMVALFDRLNGATVFTKIDLKTGYWQVRIAEGDEHKMTCVTRYGSYDFLVMPFSLTNAPAIFCILTNQVFREYIDEFVVVYLDEIVIYSKTLDEPLEHLRKILAQLREHELYVKLSKCAFTQK